MVIGITIGLVAAVAVLFFFLRARSKQHALIYLTELNKLKKSEKQLREEIATLQQELNSAMHDAVTKLLTWSFFEERLSKSIRDSEQHQLTMGVLMVEIDDFKIINHALNIDVADGVLQEVTKRLQTCIRQGDSFSRYSNDVFVIMLNQLNKPETAAVVATRILKSIEEAVFINEHKLYVTACIGVAIYPTDGQDVSTMLKCAESALNIAKKRGKHTYQFYQEKQNGNSQRELALLTDIRHELVTQQFILSYQPIMDMTAGHIFGVDTIVQWQHPYWGMVSMQELYHYAAKQGRLNAVSEWVMKQACQQFLQWRANGFEPALLGIHLSAKQLENTHFIYRISQILQELSFQPEWLLLEIKALSGEVPAAATLEKAFNMLTYLKVLLAIDEFGLAGFTLRDLQLFTVNYLKLDQALIDHIDKNSHALELIKSIVYLATNMKMRLVVQGVTTKSQAQLLQGLGCDYLQGEHFTMPAVKTITKARETTLVE